MKIRELTENINNFDNAENKVTALNPIMGDAVAVSKKTQKKFEKETAPIEDPVLGTKDDKIKENKGLTEAFESDGWELEDSDLVQVLGKLSDLKYEIDNCVRGSYVTHGIDKYGELAILVRELAEDLIDCAYELAEMDEDEDEDDEQLTEAGQFSFTNGTLEEFDPADLVEKIKNRKTAMNTIRDFNGKQYTFTISPIGSIETPDYIWVDVKEDTGNHNPKRIFMQAYTTYDVAIQGINEVKENIMDSVVDEKVEEALKENDDDPMDSKLSDEESDIQLVMWYFGVNRKKAESGIKSGFYDRNDVEKAKKYYNKKSNPTLNEDGRKNREVLTPEQKRDEDEMNSSLWGIIYNELEKDTDGSKNRVNKKASQRYTYDDLSTDADGNITVYAPVKEKLQNAINVAEAYGLKFKVGLGSTRNKNHAFACTIYIPEGSTMEE